MLDCEFHFFDFVPGTLPNTDNYKYLGHIINSKLKDDPGIMKRTNYLYARANTIMRKFSSASLQGCSLGLDVSVSRRSRDVVCKRLGLVSVSWKRGKVSVSISSRTENQMSRSRLGLVP